jgi:YidC/Oxa1 family membrane protein insertase
MNLFLAPFINGLFGFYYLTGNLAWSIVVMTVLIKILLWPLITPSIKSAAKMNQLQPKLKKLQEKYKTDKEGLAKAQMEMYKQEGINPLSGCLPQILQIVVLLLFFGAFNTVTQVAEKKIDHQNINRYLISNFRVDDNFKFNIALGGISMLDTPAKIYKKGMTMDLLIPIILLLGSAWFQYYSSKLMMPNPKVDENVVKKTEDKEDDMMSAMRTQSLYMMPLMTLFVGWNFNLGMLLYWFVNSLATTGQQLIIERTKKS